MSLFGRREQRMIEQMRSRVHSLDSRLRIAEDRAILLDAQLEAEREKSALLQEFLDRVQEELREERTKRRESDASVDNLSSLKAALESADSDPTEEELVNEEEAYRRINGIYHRFDEIHGAGISVDEMIERAQRFQSTLRDEGAIFIDDDAEEAQE